MRLLIAENDASLATFLNDGFAAEHYAVDLTHTSDEAKTAIQKNEYDAAILDLNLSQTDSMEILRHFQSERPQLPILILTNRNRPEERVQALDLGADDLVLKPFSFAELSARVRAVLRRGGRAQQAMLRMDDLEVNRVEHSVRRASRTIELTPKEFGLLEYLMRNEGQRVTRSQIIEHVWNLSFDTMTNVVDVYINYHYEELTMKEVGAVLGIGESRVSQIHTTALLRLRTRLHEMLDSSAPQPPKRSGDPHASPALPQMPVRKILDAVRA